MTDNPLSRLLKFHKSFAVELNVKKDRVRDLIGPGNWGEEGRYKEVLFASVLRQYIPDPYRVSTGFFINSDGRVSKQLDVVIRNGIVPVYFREGDFVVLPEQAVIAFIEIKTRIRNTSEFRKIFEKYATIYSSRTLESYVFLANDQRNEQDLNERSRSKIKFRGLFAYELEESVDFRQANTFQNFREILATSKVAFDHIVLGQKYFVKYWDRRDEYCIYELEDLSYTYFVSNLLNVLIKSSHISFREQYAFRYPLPRGKDPKLVGCVKRDG